MPEQQIKYRRLPGQSNLGSLGRVVKLWSAPDHLLLVTRSGYSEDYKRFYFKDIQGLIIRRTTVRQAWNVICAVIVTLVFAWTLLLGGVESSYVAGLISSPFLLVMLVNSLLGPTCALHIRTAVQTEAISSMRRLRSVKRAIKGFLPLIEAAQGTLAPEEFASMEVVVRSAADIEIPSRPGTRRDLQILTGFCTALILDGCYSAFQLSLPPGSPKVWDHIGTVLFLAAIASSAIVLVRQYIGFRDRRLLTIAWVSTVVLIVLYLVGMVVTFFLYIRDPQLIAQEAQNPGALREAIRTLGFETPVSVVEIVCDLLCSLTALLRIQALSREGAFAGRMIKLLSPHTAPGIEALPLVAPLTPFTPPPFSPEPGEPAEPPPVPHEDAAP